MRHKSPVLGREREVLLAYPPLTDPCQSDYPAIRRCVGEPMQLDLLRRRDGAKSLPMTDFLHSWPPPSIRGPIAEDFSLQRKIEYPSLLRVAGVPIVAHGSTPS